MTDNTKQPQKKGNKPSHSLCVTDKQFGKEVKFNIGSVWQKEAKSRKTYSNIRVNNLYLEKSIKEGSSELVFKIMAETYYDGKKRLAQIGIVQEENENGLMKIDHFELIILPNNQS